MAYRITPQVYEKIKHFARFPQTGVSLRQMVMFGQNPSQGTLLRASQFLADELPIRIAHRVKELDNLPHNLGEMPSIVRVKNWYAQSFEDLVNFPKPELPQSIKERLFVNSNNSANKLPDNVPNPSATSITTAAKPSVPIGHRYYSNVDGIEWPPEVRYYNEKFTKMIEAIKRRHDPVVTTVAQGINEYKKHKESDVIDIDIQAFLDRFYMSRIGIRILIGQHVALNRSPSRSDYVGIICTKTNIAQTVQEAADNARFICEEYYGLFRAPEISLHCPNDLTFTYVPTHLSHMLFELLKNSLRALVELFGDDVDEYPPIKVIVAEGKEDITIKISDEGGGIPRRNIPLVWTYMYTTAETQTLDPNFSQSDFKAPMAGFGYGLPISRLYARYFGGDLKLISMEGFGTDVYLHLNRISNSDEPLH
ncbi:mitochondrial branched-chain alpha-ketoacid dehydrogenase kinase-domain-containing protein [Glomus cerebriforme]|uniref:Protein-serine/threonine kinase n=1 Tax=Glomus cerebriforme TaxID=658196 RepID=A0A397TFW7_9GLOM|nr:mitochondrial branched-chain alpha-ketoacid dehydrogenase kinase-domain-containing protein [Glomus cerebriforme]